MTTKIVKVLIMVGGLLISCASSATIKRNLCVWDLVGKNGPIATAMEEYRLQALELGIDFTLSVFNSEKIAVEQFRSKKCEAAFLSELRVRPFVKFPASLFAVGGMPELKHVRLMHQLMASPQLADKMIEGPFEVAGIAPGGPIYIFVRDKAINTLSKAAGKKVAVLGDDPYQQQMVELIGAAPIQVTEVTAGSMFNNGGVDVLPAPAIAYSPLELYKGMTPNGGIINFPLSEISGQLLIWRDAFPSDFSQRSREIHFENFDRVMEMVNKYSKDIDPKWWVEIPEADKEGYEHLMDEVRIKAVEAGYWHPDTIKLQRRVRCKFDPTRSECAKPKDAL